MINNVKYQNKALVEFCISLTLCILFYIGGNIKEVYSLLPVDLDWLFWLGTLAAFVMSVIGLLHCRKSFQYNETVSKARLFALIGNFSIFLILLLLGLFILSLRLGGMPPQD